VWARAELSGTTVYAVHGYALADSSRFDNCIVRDRLAAILSAAARQPA